MAAISTSTGNKRSTMVLYSMPSCIHCHKVRIVLAEKAVTADIINVDPHNKPEELLSVNPYGTVPTIIDRDLILFKSSIILEYLDERFPHPPLMPVYPVGRAKLRLMMYRIEQDWESLYKTIIQGEPAQAQTAKKQLQESLISVAALFENQTYFLSDDFSLIDCCLAPLLWRLPSLGIELGPKGKAINTYANRLFDRVAFKASLTEIEEEMR